MNEIAPRKDAPPPALANRAELIKVLGQSLYVGAKPESIGMVVDYCAAAGLNVMLKPVHLVPMSVKKPGTRDQYEWRDVVMPGVNHYRVQASRSGVHIGTSEPEFGPMVTEKLGAVQVTYPEWCRVTVRKAVQGNVAEFTVIEYWLENYATAGRNDAAPNSMWKKRPRGQLAKVAEAQALRRAFPELVGGETAEEMEGKEIELRDITPPEAQAEKKVEKAKAAAKGQLDGFAGVKKAETQPEPEALDGEVLPAIPEMPEDVAETVRNGKKGPAWEWWCGAVKTLPEDLRHDFAQAHRPLIEAISKAAGGKYAAEVAEVLKDAGVTLDASETDPRDE
jgi:phage recombination protein Bet